MRFLSATFRSIALFILIQTLCLNLPLYAQSEADVRDWLESELSLIGKYPDIGNIAVRFDELFHAQLSPADLRRLKSEAAGKPDHPGHQQILIEDRRQKAGPDSREWTIWTVGPNEWRINQTTHFDPNIPFVDRVRRGGEAWMLTDEFLAVIDADRPPSGRDVGGAEGMLKVHLGDLLNARVGSNSTTISAFKDITINHGKWSATRVRVNDGETIPIIQFQGRWDAAAGRGFVEKRTLLHSPDPDAVGTMQIYSDWQRDPVLDRWVCGRVDTHAPGGRLRESLVFREATPFTPDEFENITRVPDPTGADPLRGSLTITKVNDFRSSPARWQAIVEGQIVGSGPIGITDNNATFPWRRLGWVLAVIILTALIVIRIRRS